MTQGLLEAASPVTDQATGVRAASYLPTIASPETPDPARLVGAAPLSKFLSQGPVVIQYRAESFRIVAVFGPAALEVESRIRRLHVTVDDSGLRWVDASSKPIIIQVLELGSDSIGIDLADPTHRIIDSQTVQQKIPARAATR